MRNNFFRSLVFFLLLVTYQFANAQVTPVQVTPQLVPPYSLQVSEYYSGSIPKIQVLLINRDINQPTIQVKLKMTVESQNCRLRTKEVNTVPAITLTNGVPYYLTTNELQALFSSANLDFGGGLSEQQYNQTLRLPEGLYTFTFEAYEVYSGNLVSNKGFSMGWLTLADPPLLNTPSKGEEVTPTASQNIVFNWTPRHNTSPTAAYYTEYLFTLVEYNDAALSPEAAFASSNPILQKTVSTTSMLFSNQEPITTNLEQGKRYAWRVQAKAKSNTNAQEIAMFRNNGISEVHWFVYKNSCTAPQGITVNVQGQRATIEWQNNPLHLEWKVEYREQNNPKAEWFSISNTLPRVVIMDLKPSTNYEYRVGGACYVNQFTYSPLNYFSTANAPVPPVVNCGDSTFPALGTAGLQTLSPGDTIRAGSFVVKVGYSTGSGRFTGTGYVIVPWLMNAKVEVKFTNITMSTDYKLVSGLIETTYDPTESGIDDIDEYVDIFKAGFGVGDVVTGEVTADKTVDFIVQWPNGISVVKPADYDDATGRGSSPISITLTPQGGGAATTYTVDQLPTTIKDKDGNLYQVDKAGNISQIGKAGGDVLLKQLNTKVIDKDKAEVKFVDYPTKQVYAFDEWKEVYKKSSTFSKEYERIGDYYVSQKAIAPGQTDYLKAVVTVTDTSVNPRNIEFVNGKGTIYSKKPLDSTYKFYEIAIVGGPEKDAQEIYAVYKPSSTKTLNLGKVKVSSYPRKTMDVIIIPVNGAPINVTEISNKLKTVYGKICVDFNVKLDENFRNTSWDYNKNGKLEVDASGLFSSLTDEMKALNAAYRNIRKVNTSNIYLFVLNQAATSINGATIFGDMPRGKQFGYLFTNEGNGDNLGTTAAHEIGHGVFSLKHIFDYDGITKELFTPLNTMDYPNGEYLCKKQWDFIHDPAIVFGVFENDEGSLSYSVSGGIPVKWRNRDGSVNFLTPAKTIVRLPKEAIYASFTFGIGDVPNAPEMPSGVLKSFKKVEGKDTTLYVAKIDPAKYTFLGYFSSSGVGASYMPDPNYIQDSAIVLLPSADGFISYRLDGLQYSYFTTNNTNDPIIDFSNLTTAKIDAQNWNVLDKYSFKDGQVQFGVSSTAINPQFTSIMADMDEGYKNEQYLLIAKIMEYRTVYPDIFDKMTIGFNRWNSLDNTVITYINDILNVSSDPIGFILGVPKTQITAGYFEYLYRKNDWGDLQKEEVLLHFLIEFKKMIYAENANNKATIDVIASNNYCATRQSIFALDYSKIVEAINVMSVDSLKKICPLSRANLIAKILSKMIVSDSYENAIYKLMWTCEKGEINATFLYELANTKDEDDNYILGKLVRATDDRTLFMGQNYNTLIMNEILKAYNDLLKSNHQFALENIRPFTTITLNNISQKTSNELLDLRQRIVAYNYVGFTKRLFKLVASTLCIECIFFFPQDTKTVAGFNNTQNQVSVLNQAVLGFTTINSTATKYYHPLSPIILDDKSKLLDIYATESGQYVPAIMLYFLEKKADAKTTVEAMQTMFDALTLVIPGGQASLALKLLNYADKLSSIASLAGSATAQDYPAISEYLNYTSLVLGVTNITASGFVQNAKTFDNAVGFIDKTVSNGSSVLDAENHLKAVEKILDDIEKIDVPNQTLDSRLTTVINNSQTKQMLVNTLEHEKSAALATGNSLISNRISKAIDKVKTATGTVKIAATQKIKTIFARLTTKYQYLTITNGKIYASTTQSAATQLAHVTVDGEIVIDKIEAVTSLSSNAKLVESADDVKYFTPAGGDPVSGDLLFFEDNGVIRCIGGDNCFTASTLVNTKKGLTPIKEVRVNDDVLSYDENTRKNSWQKVLNVFTKTTRKIQQIIAGKDTILCTPEHRFYTSKGWMQAAMLTTGMLLQTDTSFASVISNNEKDTSVTVYNFTVENTHTYYVGNSTLLVHNDCRKLFEILTNLGSKQAAFLNDFKNSPELLQRFINGQLNPKAWDIIRTAINNVGATTQFAKDLKTLEKVTKMLEPTSSFRRTLSASWEQDLIDILKTAETSPCLTCGIPSGISVGRTPLHEYLENVDYYITNIDRNTKGNVFYNWMRGKTLGIGEPLESQLDELHQTLSVILREGITNNELIDMGKKFPNGDKKYDIRLANGTYYELKNKVYNNISITTDDADQVINGYLKNIDNMQDFVWELKWDKNKSAWSTIDQAEAAMKEKWRSVFLARKQEIFDAMNLALKSNLQIDDIADLTNEKVESILDIIIKVF